MVVPLQNAIPQHVRLERAHPHHDRRRSRLAFRSVETVRALFRDRSESNPGLLRWNLQKRRTRTLPLRLHFRLFGDRRYFVVTLLPSACEITLSPVVTLIEEVAIDTFGVTATFK